MPLVDDPDHGAVPLITLNRRQNYQRLSDDNFDFNTEYSGANYEPPPQAMARGPLNSLREPRRDLRTSKRSAIVIASSYVFDWITIFVILGIAYLMGNQEPNRRPFSIEDPNISFPYTEHETVPAWLLITLCGGVPIIVIPIISLIFVPGHTVPRGTPKSLIWKRKLWELHVGWLGFALALASTWFITNGMKNLFGKPRPDLLSRCNADLDNFEDYVIGGLKVADGYQRLVSASICRGVDGIDLQDGFRSYPSGHASSAAAGLIYLSLFIASKFAITFPFLPAANVSNEQGTARLAFTAFPSRRTANNNNSAAAQQQQQQQPSRQGSPLPHTPLSAMDDEQQQLHAAPTAANMHVFSAHNARVSSARRQAAAPPIYLLIAATTPFFTSVFVASSRWFDFRHHGFDILFGFLIGTICAFFAFRWYHLPVSQGAGWAWGPRCADKAWWAGVGSFSYAMDWEKDVDEDGAVAWRGETMRGGPGAAMEEGRGVKEFGLSSPGIGPQGMMGGLEARRRME